jgi:hypothetical protein
MRTTCDHTHTLRIAISASWRRNPLKSHIIIEGGSIFSTLSGISLMVSASALIAGVLLSKGES